MNTNIIISIFKPKLLKFVNDFIKIDLLHIFMSLTVLPDLSIYLHSELSKYTFYSF